MKHKCLFIIGIGLLAAVGVIAQNTESPPAEDAYQYETYKVVAQRNVFSRNRRPAETRDRPERPVQKKTVVLSLYVLKGTAVNQTQKVAFIEEEMSGNTIRGRVGTELMNGKIKDIRVGRVIFEENDQLRVINIGEPFGKMESQTEVPDESGDASPSIEASESSETTPTEASEMLKKMMQRRKSELGS